MVEVVRCAPAHFGVARPGVVSEGKRSARLRGSRRRAGSLSRRRRGTEPDPMPAIIHPGAVIHYWDHVVITLREDAVGAASAAGAAGAADAPAAAAGPSNATANETGSLSLYAITYSPTLGAGHVAIVEAGDLAATFTDDPGLGDRQQARLVGMGDARAALRRPPILATFERLPYGADGFGYRLSSEEHVIEARWEATDQ